MTRDRKKNMMFAGYAASVLCASVNVSGAAANSGNRAEPERPNIIFLLVDDLGWSDTRPYGTRYYDTPNITRLAGEGMRFTNGYTASALSSASRASIMSGQHPARLRLTSAITHRDVSEPTVLEPAENQWAGDAENRRHLPLEVYTLAQALRDAGYNTAHIGKWHLCRNDEKYFARNRGFDFVIGGDHIPCPPDYYSPYAYKGQTGTAIANLVPGPVGEEYLNERLAEECVKWIESVKDSGNPFYLNWWSYAVHTPVVPKRDLLPKYKRRKDPRNRQQCPEIATMIESMDNALGIVLDYLDRPGNKKMRDNTIFVFTSDNGGTTHQYVNNIPLTSNKPLRGGKANTYEGGIRIPLIVRWPGHVSEGVVNAAPVQTMDFYPTLVSLAGGALPEGTPVDAVDILPVLRGGKVEDRPLFTHFPHVFGGLCASSTTVRYGDYKLIRFYYAAEERGSHHYELFDLGRDPGEYVNLASHMPGKVKELDAMIDEFLAGTDALVPIENRDYKGNPQAFRRPMPGKSKAIYADRKNIDTGKGSGSAIVTLTNDLGKKVWGVPLVVEGGEWITAKTAGDGSIEITWEANGNGPGKVLIGLNGGVKWEYDNDWTIPPAEVTLK